MSGLHFKNAGGLFFLFRSFKHIGNYTYHLFWLHDVFVFCMILKINRVVSTTQHSPIGYCNEHSVSVRWN